MNEPWRITLFGGLVARQGNKTITRFKSQKIASLLAFLAVHLRQTHSREALIELLWPEGTLEAGRNSLSVALSSLRHQFEPPGVPANSVIRADRFSVGLNPAAVTTDVVEFEAAVQASARAQDERERAEHLDRALDLYGGKLLPSLYEEWIAGEQERFAALFFDAAARLVRQRERAGDIESALACARRAVSVDPLHEEAQHTLIRLLDASGQPGAALRQFRDYESRLDKEMADEPGADLRALARQIEKRSGLAAPPLPVPAVLRPPKRSAATTAGPTTVTFLLTDIEGSTRGWEKGGDAYKQALAEHHRLLREEFSRHGGEEVKEVGDGFVIAFAGAVPALRCAVAAQQALAAQPWPDAVGSVRVRMALHSGDVEQNPATGEYQGLVLHRASRLLSAAHGGQILLSEVTAGLVRRDLPEDVRLLDLGVYRLRDLPSPERLFQVEHPGMAPASFPPLLAEAGHAAAGLPLTFTRFFGRERELVRLQELLTAPDVRLITITGPGGTGKTRVSIETARRAAADAFAGAAWFVPLADIAAAGLIAGAILDALRLPRSPQQEPLDQAVEFLSRQSSLLVLDNLEQLVENGGAEVVQELLARVPALTLLVTSRQLLGLSSEREFALSPLPTPNGGEDAEHLSAYDSVQLFVDRAQQVLPDFQVTNMNAAAVAELVSRLEGIPLAIELAAARALVLTPSQMLAQLENRFTFLSSRRRDVFERHRTLRAAVDWSYRLLAPELQRFFTRLSVFRGGWTAEAAEAVCEEPLALDYLAQLRECSLVLSQETNAGMRFSQLETLREFGQEQVSPHQSVALSARHAEYFDALAEWSFRMDTVPANYMGRWEIEHDNIRAALLWCKADDSRTLLGLRLMGALYWFWINRGHLSEARRHLAELLSREAAAQPTPERAAALDLMATLADRQGDHTLARPLFEEGLSLWRLFENKGRVIASLNQMANSAQDREVARSLWEETVAMARDAGKRDLMAPALCGLGTLAFGGGDYAAARAYWEETLEINKETMTPRGGPHVLRCLARLARREGDDAAARALLEESLAAAYDIGPSKPHIAESLYHLGRLAFAQGDYDLAGSQYRESLALFRELGDRGSVVDSLRAFADLAAARGNALHAAGLLGASESLRESIHFSLSPSEQQERDATLAALCQTLDEPGFTAAWKAGQQMNWQEATALALAEPNGEKP